ncbi:MAG TPA: O-antigen ligase family protein, partial [bacterium]|nr:O-antigen ligase family protein [bacterium]
MKAPRFVLRFQVLLVLAALFLVPLIFSSATISTVFVKALAMNVLLGCCVALEIFRLGLEARLRPLPTPLGLPVGCYLLWMGLSALFGGVHPVEVAALQRVICVVFLGYFIATCGHRLHLYRRVVMVLLSVGAITGAYAIVQILELDFFDWWRFEWSLPVRRVCASFGNPTFFAGYLIPLIPLALAVRETTRRPLMRHALLALAFLDLVALGLTFSKAGVLGVMAALGSWFVLRSYGRLSARSEQKVVSCFLISVGAVVLFGSVGRSLAGVDKISESIVVSSGGRSQIYRSAAGMLRSNPIFGVGPGMFGHEFPKYRTPELTLFHPPHKQLLTHAHCEYFEQAAELGIVGLAAFLWIVFTAIRTALAKRRSCPLAVGVVAGLVGVLVDSFFSVNLRKEPNMMSFWTLIGLAICLGSRSPVVRRAQWRPALRLLSGGMALLLAFGVSFAQGRDLIVDLLLRQKRA